MSKKLLFSSGLSTLFVILYLNASAAIHVVQVSSNQFSPNSMNVNVSDTVRFTWVSGNHTATSVSIPNGAATWDSPMTSSVSQFDYKVTVAGSYSYKCTPHALGGMVASFTASSITGIDVNSQTAILTSIFPNPFTNELFIEQGNEEPEYTQISISDILGKEIKNITIENLSSFSRKRRIDVSELQRGIYFVTLKGNGTKSKTIRLVKEGA